MEDKEAEIQALKEAMALFTVSAQRLERSHEALRNRVAELTAEVSSLQNRLEKVLSAISDGVVACDRDGRITTLNAAASALGLEEGTRLEDTPELDAASTLLPLLRRAMEAEPPRSVEVEVRAPSGERRALSVSADPLQDENGRIVGAVASLRDVTELRSLRRDLERKERLALLGQMAASIAHEIRNPLGGIRIYLGLLQRDPANHDEPIREIEKAISEMDRIISDVLTFARDMKPSLQEFALSPLAEGVLRSFSDARSRDVRTANRIPGDLSLRADPGLIERALSNLVSNALQAAGPGGEVLLEAEETPGSYIISVADSGPGLSPEAAARAFEPFYTSRADGTGLGLAIVERIAEAHGGSAFIRNRPSGGAEAGIELPKGT